MWKLGLKDKCKLVPQSVRDAISALEPFIGGTGYMLEVLHQLNLIDKHRNLLQFGYVVAGVTLVIPDRAEDDSSLHRADMNIVTSFCDVPETAGQTVLQILGRICDQVDAAVRVIQAA